MHRIKNKTIYDHMTEYEKEVAIFLKNIGIKWLYEHPVFIWDENKRPRVWAPDFYLIPFGIYIEVCGSKNFDYDYRRRIFDKNGYKVIFLHLYKNKDQWKNHLMRYLRLFTHCSYRKLNELLGN
jgi:hypothetical protein